MNASRTSNTPMTIDRKSPIASWRLHLPLLRTMLLLAALIGSIGFFLNLIRDPGNITRIYSDRWEWAPAASLYEAAPPASGWMSRDQRPASSGADSGKYYWFKISLPEGSWSDPDPYLMINNVGSVRVWAEGKWVYGFDLKKRHDRINLGYRWNMARVPSPMPKEVYALISTSLIKVPPSLKLGNRSDLLSSIIRKDLDNLIIGAMLGFCSLVALGLYSNRKDKLHLHFFVFCLVGCYSASVRNNTLQILWDFRWLTYFQSVGLIFAVVAFMGMTEALFPDVHGKFSRVLRRVMFGCGVGTLIVSLFSPAGYNVLILFPFYPLFILVVCSLFRTFWTAYRTRKDPESVWMLAGFAAMTGVALIHVLRFMQIPLLSNWAIAALPFLQSMPPDLIFWGLMLFVVCIVRVIIYRFGAMNRQLTDFNRSLERLVAERTAELRQSTEELETANARLSASMRETAEAMAETMVLEERRRVTGTIHDSIGHVLTATVVQLEAARRLIDRNVSLSLEKLQASQDLVSKGLDEIRSSARLTQDNTVPFDLPTSMANLIRDTRALTGIHIVSRIGELPDQLSTLQKRVLYQALQEGLTNGIRHGASKRFEFDLYAAEDVVLFRLSNDGRTYSSSDFGFGLKAMAERVTQLGGTMKVEPGDPGCILELRLPVAAKAELNPSAID